MSEGAPICMDISSKKKRKFPHETVNKKNKKLYKRCAK